MSCSVQPGAVATDIGGDDQGFFVNLLKRLGTGGKYLTPEEGAYNMCWVATTERENLENGAYYEPVGWRGEYDWCFEGPGGAGSALGVDAEGVGGVCGVGCWVGRRSVRTVNSLECRCDIHHSL